ncbi:MAG: xanthine dehydrogenase small subunit [Hyphomonadaceae bacterium]|nr:xanthine dehydrogenase small subunit [Hyphomonadaceae bacterium]
MSALRFVLNGEGREERAPPSTTVLDWLRLSARLTGTKEGCAEGDCGACTIVIRRPGENQFSAVNSCLLLLPQLDGCEVMTVEGLSGPDGPLHPVQQALVDTDGTQCGFCTPGFAMAMFAFRDGGEPAEAALIHEALAGNLCRCTGYRAIVDACRKLPAAPAQPAAAGGAGSVSADGPSLGAHACGGQAFHAPATLAELMELRAAHPDAVLLAGGTDLGLRVSKQQEAFARVISTQAVSELATVRAGADALHIGGGATYTQALPLIDAKFPAFGALIRRIGSRQIRNLGTLAGNLATASPIGDTLPCLMALDAEVLLRARGGARVLKVEDFITGYRKTALAPDEIIAEIRLPYLPAGRDFAAYKVSKRFDQDISTVVAAFVLRREGEMVGELKAAFGGMAARPARAAALERALAGKPWTPAAHAGIDALLAEDFSPLSDHRGGATYRLRAAAGLVRRFQLETTLTGAPLRVEAL